MAKTAFELFTNQIFGPDRQCWGLGPARATTYS